jgi:hypothetical protein
VRLHSLGDIRPVCHGLTRNLEWKFIKEIKNLIADTEIYLGISPDNFSATMLQQIGEWFGSGTSTTENKGGSTETAVTNERVVDLKTLIFFGMMIIIFSS